MMTGYKKSPKAPFSLALKANKKQTRTHLKVKLMMFEIIFKLNLTLNMDAKIKVLKQTIHCEYKNTF